MNGHLSFAPPCNAVTRKSDFRRRENPLIPRRSMAVATLAIACGTPGSPNPGAAAANMISKTAGTALLDRQTDGGAALYLACGHRHRKSCRCWCDRRGHRHDGCRRGPCGPRGPRRPSGKKGFDGKQVPFEERRASGQNSLSGSISSIDTTLVSLTFPPFDTNFTANVVGGTTWIKDPRTAPPQAWHSLSAVPGYPTGVIGVSLTEAAAPLSSLLITVLTSDGTLAETKCILTAPAPAPGPAWGSTYCAPFTVITPPSGL